VKIYADRAYLPDGVDPVELLYPFWDLPPEPLTEPMRGRFDEYARVGHELFELTGLAEADLALFPGKWEQAAGESRAIELATELASAGERYGKRVLVFFWSDSEEPVPVPNAVVLRTSLSRSGRRPGEFAMPSWSEDFVAAHLGGQLPLRRKAAEPVVGFCGKAPRPPGGPRARFAHSWRRLAGRSPYAQYEHIRAEALDALGSTRGLRTNVVLRDAFFHKLGDLPRLRVEYVENMVASDYVLCVRGSGNFSYRLYETLSCGRIPVFVDTDCVLPYDWEIDWRHLCVWVDADDVKAIGRRVRAYHEALSAAEFEERQRECRAVWEQWISPTGFFGKLGLHLTAAEAG
jgi:hypothetical protein